MSYFAAAAVRGPDGWDAQEFDLTDVADLDEVADRLRDTEPAARVWLLFVESDDAYLVIVRVDESDELRVFGSDSAFAEESRLGALLIGDIKLPALDFDDDIDGSAGVRGSGSEESEQPAADPDADPVGDSELLADLGVPGRDLLALCARDGVLPADITAEVCQILGCGDEVEELRIS